MDSVLQTLTVMTLLTDVCTATDIKDLNKRDASVECPLSIQFSKTG